jgi:electron transport complex protein RnfG
MLTAMIGIDKDGAITGVKVTDHADAPGVGTKAHDAGHLSQYEGLTELTSDQVKSDSSVQHVTGASVSSGAIHKAVYCALAQFDAMGGVK